MNDKFFPPWTVPSMDTSISVPHTVTKHSHNVMSCTALNPEALFSAQKFTTFMKMSGVYRTVQVTKTFHAE